MINDNEILYFGDTDTTVFLFKKYEPIIYAAARKYIGFLKNSVIGYDDLIQGGYIALYNSIKNFKKDNNCLFYTYATKCIYREIIKIVSMANRRYSLTSSYLSSISDDNIMYSYEVDYDSFLFEDELYRFCLGLNFDFSAVFQLRICGFTYKEISTLLDISVKKVDYILQKCKNNLKKTLFE